MSDIASILALLISDPNIRREFREAMNLPDSPAPASDPPPASGLRDARRVAEDVRDFYSIHGFSSDGGPIINAHVSATLDAFVEYRCRTYFGTPHPLVEREALAAFKKENNLPC